MSKCTGNGVYRFESGYICLCLQPGCGHTLRQGENVGVVGPRHFY